MLVVLQYAKSQLVFYSYGDGHGMNEIEFLDDKEK